MSEAWDFTELGEVGIAVLDCDHRTPREAGYGHPYIAIPNLVDGRLDLRDVRRITDDQLREWTRRTRPRGGDIVVTRRGRVGYSAVIPDGLDCAIGQNLVILRSTADSIDQRYLRWAARGPLWAAEVDRLHNVGAVFDSLNVRDISRLRIPVPPLADQRAIAEALEALDDKIAVNERIAATAMDLGAAYYTQAVGESQGWPEVPLRDAARWLSGGTPRTSEPSYWGGDVPWISASSLHYPWIDDSDRKLTAVGAQNGARLVPPGTTIFVVRGMSLKSEFRIGITQREVAFGQDCKALMASREINPILLFYSIRSRTDEILAMVEEAGHGTGRLSTDRLARLAVPVPEQAEQERLVARLKPLVEIGGQRQRENRTLAELRDTLLPKLVSGELRVKDVEV